MPSWYEFLVNTQSHKVCKVSSKCGYSFFVDWLSAGRTRDLYGQTARRIEMPFGIEVGPDQVTLC